MVRPPKLTAMTLASLTGFLLLILFFLVSPSCQKSLYPVDLQHLADALGDELLTHQGLLSPDSTHNNAIDRDIEIPHPVEVHNWGPKTVKLGQVTGVSIDPDDRPVIFHRGSVVWDATSFDPSTNNLRQPKLIPEATLLTLDPESGEVVASAGQGLFYMPHGLTIDREGNTYVTDVGAHTVMRFAPGTSTPNLVLGESLVSGSDSAHFCKPTSVAVSDATGDFFVGDGYCNSRIMRFDKDGKLIKIIARPSWRVVHSLTLNEDQDELCLADRENQRIECLQAGVKRTLNANDGHTVSEFGGIGRTFAVAAKGEALLVVTGSDAVNKPHGITFDNSGSGILRPVDTWGVKEDQLNNPHDIAISNSGSSLYVVEIGPNQVRKFEVIHQEDYEIF